ncbi:unnamed protein product [Pieris macdunnoughi]|uniref:Uncharacterized protein n=1 Tax=Pieris macdunnoughi TaxID=345717 RepID=A0A821RJL0_9NEOP|nr:unnamed protein product [Pieris macdunnoughi]
MEHPGGFASSPWAAMLGHGMHGMMQHEYAHGHAHTSMPMDLHVPQAFPYYRYLGELRDVTYAVEQKRFVGTSPANNEPYRPDQVFVQYNRITSARNRH